MNAAAAAAAGGGGGAAAGSVGPAGRRNRIRGFTGNNITNPTEFLESVLESLPGVEALFARAAGGGEAPTFVENKVASGNLVNGENHKEFQNIPVIGMQRVSASGEGLCCFFDSFLSCMSPKYRTLSIPNRSTVFILFRRWCGNNAANILKVKPPILTKTIELSDEKFTTDMKNVGKEIEYISGWLVGWYFGVNITYVRKDIDKQYNILCELAYQSSECKTVIIRQGAGHFEPVGFLVRDADRKLNEEASKFLFDWTDQRLCALKILASQCKSLTLDNTWNFPNQCASSDAVKAAQTQVNADKARDPLLLRAKLIRGRRLAIETARAGVAAGTEDPAALEFLLREAEREGDDLTVTMEELDAAVAELGAAGGGGGGGAAAGGSNGLKGGARKTRKSKKAMRRTKRRARTQKKSKKTRRY